MRNEVKLIPQKMFSEMPKERYTLNKVIENFHINPRSKNYIRYAINAKGVAGAEVIESVNHTVQKKVAW